MCMPTRRCSIDRKSVSQPSLQILLTMIIEMSDKLTARAKPFTSRREFRTLLFPVFSRQVSKCIWLEQEKCIDIEAHTNTTVTNKGYRPSGCGLKLCQVLGTSMQTIDGGRLFRIYRSALKDISNPSHLSSGI